MSNQIKCAIYSSKSCEDRLEQSLATQRLAGERYIKNQQGWKIVDKKYEDYSGDDRPGLKELFREIEAGGIDIVVVYQVKQLSRSLPDFLEILNFFDKHKIALVSVTESFNTSDSTGRLILNTILSFAQYRGELTGKKDKPSLGYFSEQKMSNQCKCAIYTSESYEEGLEQSLSAQRFAGERYIENQQGWKVVDKKYGDYSGDNIERHALKELLRDIEAGEIDIVVIYKIDRLSMSLLNFLEMLNFFDKHKIALVSVTELFNTSVSSGRLMLNTILSFAQYKRELTGKRDKPSLEYFSGQKMSNQCKCAIYTSKSSEEGLEQSLEAQRFAGEKYVKSQKGWEIVGKKYEDCGKGHALKGLCRDIEEGEIDIVVVYRIEQLSRSLLDFVKISNFFDKHKVTLVSVTESFNFSNSMERMMLRMTISLAQYKKELTEGRGSK